MSRYLRPIAQTDAARPDGALPLAGGWTWFDRVELLSRGRPPRILNIADLTGEEQDRLSAPRAAIAGLDMRRPALMGIVNVTPDSFSDGGLYGGFDAAVAHGRTLVEDGADLLDIGGESTRPGATEVPIAEEIARTAPVIAALAGEGLGPISIDTRKAAVAASAVAEGAVLINDVSAMAFDPEMAVVMAASGAAICLMHARGLPETMQKDPRYGDVLLDVYDALAARLDEAEAAGIDRRRIVVDPGIGFGKTTAHNLALMQGLSLFHNLGCPVLLGASRKRFIGEIGDSPDPQERVFGSIAVALAGVAQGVQILRVHDVAETRQALRLHMAVTGTA